MDERFLDGAGQPASSNGFAARGDEPCWYEIRLHGHLDGHWAEWFEGLTVAPALDGTTTLSGWVLDQAALHGLLRRVGDLGMTLISVNVTDGAATAQDDV